MFSFRKSYFRLVGLFDWRYARTQFFLSVSRNRYGFILAGYRNEKSATDPALQFREHTALCISPMQFVRHIFTDIYSFLLIFIILHTVSSKILEKYQDILHTFPCYTVPS